MRNSWIQFSQWLFLPLAALGIPWEAGWAGSLDYWKFNAPASRLEIVTEDGVRPRVQLLGRPPRLVIDLPGTTLPEPGTLGPISRFVREVRVRQFDRQTTRIVIELAPDYGLLPQGVRVRSLAPNRWFVQLPSFLPLSDTPLADRASAAIAVPPPKPYPTVRYRALIDPGHGGQDPGATGPSGLPEKNIVLSIALEVGRILERQGVGAVLTRAGDRFVSLQERVRKAEQVDADVLVSIHANSIGLGRGDVNGLETYYYRTGEALARSIHQSILRRLRPSDRGVRRARFYVLRESSMPSTLVEVGFVTGRLDGRHLSDPRYRQRMAAAIAEGILDYFRNR